VTRENGQGAAQRETGSGLGAVGRGASERVSAENKPNGVLIRVAAHGLGVSGWDSSAAFLCGFCFCFCLCSYRLACLPLCLASAALDFLLLRIEDLDATTTARDAVFTLRRVS
jgi:hypothetical protein